MRPLVVGLIAAFLAGCASESATFVNDRGERRTCNKSGGGGLTSADRTRDFDRCLNAALLDGFRRIDQ
jgi:hypothetical protein